MASAIHDSLNTCGLPANGGNGLARKLYGADDGISIARPFAIPAIRLSVGQFAADAEFCIAHFSNVLCRRLTGCL